MKAHQSKKLIKLDAMHVAQIIYLLANIHHHSNEMKSSAVLQLNIIGLTAPVDTTSVNLPITLNLAHIKKKLCHLLSL